MSGENTGADGSGGEGSDFFSQYQREMGETRQTATEAAGRASKAEQTLARLQQALSGDEKEASQDEWFDEIMNQAFEAEKNGQSMPITVQIATQLMNTQKQLAKATQVIQNLQQKQEILADPEVTDENMAYSDIDKQIKAQLKQVYSGQDSPYMKDAVASSIVAELKDMQRNDPNLFKQVIYDEATRNKMVKHFVMQVVPHKARQIVSEVREATAPITEQDWQQAWAETNMIEDPRLRSQTKEVLRQEILAARNSGKFRRR